MKLQVGQEFNRIVDVMNDVFGWNYKACMRGYYPLNEHAAAWFPKIAILNVDIPEPGDKWYGWCNTISEDGNFIYMNNFENPERMKMSNHESPKGFATITFIKYPRGKYQYSGIYICERLDPEKGWVNRRIAKDIDVSEYL